MAKKKAVPVVVDDAPAAPVPEFRQEPRPRFVDPALLALPPETVIRWRTLPDHSPGVAQGTAKDLIATIEEQIARQALGLFTIEETASDIGQIHGWNWREVEKLCKDMMQAVRAEALKVRRSRNGPAYVPGVVRGWFEFVTHADVNAWLAKKDEPYRWPTYEEAGAAPRFIGGRRLWRLSDAIRYVCAIPGLNVSAADLAGLIAENPRGLTFRDPATGAALLASGLAVFLDEWLYAEDFNSFLVRSYPEPYRLPEDAAAEVQSMAPLCDEAPKERRARLLEWLEDEEAARGKAGALMRVFAREKAHRPTADRSNIGKDIKTARAERADMRREGNWIRWLGKQS